MLKLGFRRTSSNIQIKEATTIAAYVAYTHKPLRTNEVLGVRNGKLHSVNFWLLCLLQTWPQAHKSSIVWRKLSCLIKTKFISEILYLQRTCNEQSKLFLDNAYIFFLMRRHNISRRCGGIARDIVWLYKHLYDCVKPLLFSLFNINFIYK